MSDLVKLLAPFRTELAQIESGERELDDPVDLHEGIQEGVVGMLDAILEKANTKLEFDPSLRAAAAALERRERRKKDPSLASVLRVFRDVAGMYPDVLGTGYGGTPEDFAEFRRLIVPRLLQAAREWAETHESQAVDELQELAEQWELSVGEQGFE